MNNYEEHITRSYAELVTERHECVAFGHCREAGSAAPFAVAALWIENF